MGPVQVSAFGNSRQLLALLVKSMRGDRGDRGVAEGPFDVKFFKFLDGCWVDSRYWPMRRIFIR